MAEEPSAKRHHGETSDKRNNLVDVHVPGKKRDYTKTLTRVELHGKEMLEIVCTSEPDKADEMISRLWRKRILRVPYTGKEYDSLTDVAASVIHPFYKGMKKNIDTQEDHKLWGISPLPDNLIEYAEVDVYVAYKSWNMIDNITNGWEIAKAREADQYYNHPFHPF
ncbi:hypothetical protein VPH35_104776 [Triticum aestivum]